MPFLRFSRDKRGYEHIYLVHDKNRRGKPSRPRVLYWYRTPPGVRVGRPPFDDEVRRRLEAQNPEIAFDWPTLVATPMPPPAENEQWRERRRAERAAKHAQRVEEAAERTAESPAAQENSAGSIVEINVDVDLTGDEPEPIAADAVADPVTTEATPERSGQEQGRRKRRRGGRRRKGRRNPPVDGQVGLPQAQGVSTPDGGSSSEPFDDSETTKSFGSNDE